MIGRTSATTLKKGEPAVRLEGVVKTFGEVRAVDGLELRVERAQVLALLGPNGAGKTTTVEMCEGFVTPDAGSVRVLGLDPIADSAALRPRIGVMLQGGGAYPGSKAGEMLDLVASYSANPLDPEWLLRSLGCRTPAAPRTAVCPADSSSDCRWRALSSDAPNWSSSTSRPPGWTRRRACWSGSWSTRCAGTVSVCC